jgi:hypothetical protein
MSTEWIQKKPRKRKNPKKYSNFKDIKGFDVLQNTGISQIPLENTFIETSSNPISLPFSPFESATEGFQQTKTDTPPLPKDTLFSTLFSAFTNSITVEGFKEGMDCPHIFKDLPGLGNLIYIIKHLFDFVEYCIRYISTAIVNVASKSKKNIDHDINVLSDMMYLTCISLFSYYILYNWYFVLIFCNNDDTVRSILANGKLIEVGDDFFFKLFGIVKTGPVENGVTQIGDTPPESLVGLLNYFFIHTMSAIRVIFLIFFNKLPYLINLMPNKVIFILLHLFILFFMTTFGTVFKGMYSSLFDKDFVMDKTLYALVSLLILISLVSSTFPFFMKVLAKLGKGGGGIIGFVIAGLVVLIQWVISFLGAVLAVFFITFFIMFYSFFSIFYFTNITKTLEIYTQFGIDGYRDNDIPWMELSKEEKEGSIVPGEKAADLANTPIEITKNPLLMVEGNDTPVPVPPVL